MLLVFAFLLSIPVLFLGERASSQDFAKELIAKVEGKWKEVEGRDLGSFPYRDKNRFSSTYQELCEKIKVEEKEILSALKAVEKLCEERKANSHFIWRGADLLGAMHSDLKQFEKSFVQYQKALQSYPDENYKDLRKHGYFQHLANGAAGVLWDWKGSKLAVDFFLKEFRENPRFHYAYVSWWTERFEKEGLEEEGSKFLRQIAEIYREKAKTDGFVKDLLEKLLEEVRAAEPEKPFLIGGDAKKKYFLRRPESLKQGDSLPLVLILPGGNGQAREFLPWLTQLHRESGRGMVFAVLSAPVWSEDENRVVWVTTNWMSKYKNATFPVERFIGEAVEDLRAKKLFTIEKVLLLGWSSSGPALYSAALEKEKVPYDGYYILSSVFKPEQLEMKFAKGKKFYLHQGSEDQVTALHFAKRAEKDLKKNGAVVTLEVFQGGHGFAMENPFESVRKGLDWLLEKRKSSE